MSNVDGENSSLSQDLNSGSSSRQIGTVPVSMANQQESDLTRFTHQIQNMTQSSSITSAPPSSSSRRDCQIYLTFPAQSTFTEEDVKEHFSKWGTVDDVRIPEKEKRNFGFVTFSSPSPVRALLSSQEEHKVKGYVIFVKPYSDKGKNTRTRAATKAQMKTTKGNAIEMPAPPNPVRTFQQPLEENPIRITGQYPSVPLQYTGLYSSLIMTPGTSAQNPTSLILLQHQQLLRASNEIILHRQRETILRQQIAQLQAEVWLLKQNQRKGEWRGSANLAHQNSSFGESSSHFQRNLETSLPSDSTFGKVIKGNEGTFNVQNSTFGPKIGDLERSEPSEKAMKSPISEGKHSPTQKQENPKSIHQTSENSVLLDNTYGWPNVEFVPQPEGHLYSTGNSSGLSQGPFQGRSVEGFLGDTCHTCLEMTVDLVVLDCKHTHCVSCFAKEFSKPSSVCSVCHSPVSVTTSKTDNPWRAQTDILPPYHNNTTNTTRGDESGMSSDWPR